MKILGSLFGINISTRGMSIQRKKMDVITENIANADSVRTQNGDPYKRKFWRITENQSPFEKNLKMETASLRIQSTNGNHLTSSAIPEQMVIENRPDKINMTQLVDEKAGDMVYMPDHPDADKDGYVEMSNVSIITEMTDMIAASRSYEANLQALNSSKQMIKDSLDI